MMDLTQKVDKLFHYEENYKKEGCQPEEILKRRKQDQSGILAEILACLDQYGDQFLPKGKAGQAIFYLKNNWENLTRYISNGALDISNNRAERAVKPFVIGRKNWLFCNCSQGAEASSVIYSMIESAKMNGLKIYEYLEYILEKVDASMSEDELRKLLPYSPFLPESLKVKR